MLCLAAACSCERPAETPPKGDGAWAPRPQPHHDVSSLPLVEEAPERVKAGSDPEKQLIYLWQGRSFSPAALGAGEGAQEGFQRGWGPGGCQGGAGLWVITHPR